MRKHVQRDPGALPVTRGDALVLLKLSAPPPEEYLQLHI